MSQIKKSVPIRTPIRSPRERLWDAIRLHAAEFDLESVIAAAEMKYHSGYDYVKGLIAAGYVAPVVEGARQAKGAKYYLKRDTGHEAPRVNRRGQMAPESKAEAMWRTLRVCDRLTPRQLAELASVSSPVSEHTSKTYLSHLYEAGFLELVRPSSHLAQAAYRLKRHYNTGPKPPQITRAKRVYDPNTGVVVYQEQPECAEELRDGLTKENHDE